VEIAVGLNVDGEAPVFAVREGGANGGRGAVTHRASSLTTDVLIVLVEVPQPARPAADEPLPGDERPNLVLDLIPELATESRTADWTGLPTKGRGLHLSLARLVVSRRKLGSTLLNHAPAIGSQLTIDLLNQRRQRGLGVRGYVDVGVDQVLEILQVALYV